MKKIIAIIFLGALFFLPAAALAKSCCVCKMYSGGDELGGSSESTVKKTFADIADDTGSKCTVDKKNELNTGTGLTYYTCSIAENDGCVTSTAEAAPAMTTLDEELGLKNIVLGVTIPNLHFSAPPTEVDSEGNIYIPWAAEYVKAVYNFAVVVISILAVVVLIISGAQIIASAGGPAKAAAYKRITQAVIGAFIAWGSYLVLYTINPNLTVLQSLKIEYVEKINVETYVETAWSEPPDVGGSGALAISNTTYDNTFKNFAACYNISWKLLKAIAYKESHLDTNSVNKFGFIGLFQTKQKNCEGELSKKYPAMSLKCSNLKDPEINTAVGASMVSRNVKIIESSCPSASAKDKLALIYLGHNSGTGALKYIVQTKNGGGCTENLIRAGTVNFWEQHLNGKYAGQGFGTKRSSYAYKVAEAAMSLGVTSITADSNEGTCPYNK